MEENKEIGIVYLLTNPCIPGLVKIGVTKHEDVKMRMSQLYSTGVPLPFECAYAALVRFPEKVEAAFHNAFAPNRINPKREFFEIDAGQAISLLKLLEISNATNEVAKEHEVVDIVERNAGAEFAKKRPNLNFIEMGIPVGSELISARSGEVATVTAPKLVKFREEEMSLSKATRLILELEYNVAPGSYWFFEGRLLRDVYNETYERGE